MRKGIAWTVVIWIFTFSFANSQDINRRWGLGGGLALKDYQSLPVDGSFNSNTLNLSFYAHLGRVLAPSWEIQLAGMFPYPNFSYSTNLEPNFQTSFHVYYRLNNGYILKKTSKIGPYLAAGFMGTYQNFQDQDYFLSVPVGLGLRLQAAKFISLQFGGNYHLSAVANRSLPLVSFQGGLTLHFGKSKGISDKSDTDGDGIKDKKDNCPNIAGLAEFQGCPDTDLDGVEDKFDKCLYVPGIPENEGCPRGDTDQDGLIPPIDLCPEVYGTVDGCPDSDKDGIVDKDDGCPSEPGGPETKGCPDGDGDGIPDREDRCPDEVGLAEYGGCLQAPSGMKQKLDALALQVQFAPETADLMPASLDALDQLAEIMEGQQGLSLKIAAFTDDGVDKYQRFTLAQERAEACKSYLTQQKGIPSSSILTQSYGSFMPIVDNFNTEARDANNRVSFQFFLP